MNSSKGDYMDRSHLVSPLPAQREPAPPLPDDGSPVCAGGAADANALLAGVMYTGEGR